MIPARWGGQARQNMHPDLIKTHFTIPGFGPLELPAYFTAVTLGYVFAILLLWLWGKRGRVNPDGILDLGILMVVTGILGARILSVIADGHFWDYVHLCTDPMKVNWPLAKSACMSERYSGIWDPMLRVCHPDYRDCLSWLKFWRGGLAFYGGLILATVSGIVFLRAKRMPVMRVVDGSGWVIPLGLGWGRIGCIFNGCCFGSPTDSWFSFVFPAGGQASLTQFRQGLLNAPGLESLPVVPTQWIEAVGAFLISLVCYQLVERTKRFNGQTFLVFIILYAALRFFEEVWRRDARGELWGLSTSQLIAVASILCVAAVYGVLIRRRRQSVSS
jgi:phosphatidylglycerol:prolipoprotein diacylglycerol transferase